MLTGSGRAFCVGQDLKEHIADAGEPRRDALFATVEEHYNPIVTALATMPKPVVAAVNGVAAGAGASLAFACDFRVVVEAAGFNLAFAGVALSCDTGSSLDAAPARRAAPRRWSCSTSRAPIGADEALELGLATQRGRRRRASRREVADARRAGWPPARRWRYGAIRRSVAFAAAHALRGVAGVRGRR